MRTRTATTQRAIWTCLAALTAALTALSGASLARADLLPPLPSTGGVVGESTSEVSPTADDVTTTTNTVTTDVSETLPASPLPSCPGQTYVQPFLPWLDYANYVLLPGGSLESTQGWRLSGGAKLVRGNEPFRVNSSKDSRSLSLPSGSSATSASLCVTLLHPTLRFFAVNTGSVTAALKVEAITTVGGIETTTPVGLLFADGRWKPTLPLAFLDNVLSPVSGTVAFRFTPVGSAGAWRIDDVYVDPFKER